MKIRKKLMKRAEKLPDNPCGGCKFYDPIHQISPKLSEGWCRVHPSGANLVLSEETCEKWSPKT